MIKTRTIAAICFVGTALAASTGQAEEKKEKVFAADKGPGVIDITSFPEPIQKLYPLFSVKCAKCHPLARGINTDKEVSAWMYYVKRMTRKPDSGISPKIAKELYKFLKFYQLLKDKKKAKKAG